MNADAPRVLIIGPTPPPFHGVATFIRDMLRAPEHFPTLRLDTLDTSDRRDASNLGRWEAGNLALGFANLAEMASRLGRQRQALVYVPISQNIPAFLRDTLFIAQARLFGARVVLQLHGGYFRDFYENETPGWFRRIARWALNQAAAVIVLSPEFRSIFDGLVPAERIVVVENGVPDLFESATETPARSAPERPTILFMSTLCRGKGIMDLIHAMPRVRAAMPDVRLRIAGHWSEADAHEEALAFIEASALSGCIEFCGNVDGAAKRDFLLSGSLFCLPTRYRYEGQPLAILEALSAGLPVLSTRQGAIGSTLLDGVTGPLLEPGCSVDALADALIAMLQNPQRLAEQSAAARERFRTTYTLRHCHTQLARVFELALK